MNILKSSWRKRTKLLSQLLCIGAVFTACTDDEVVNQADKAPLQVSVNTSLAKQSRAIVHGEWLPSGSSIGVSLFDTEGDDYDEQGYYNIQYKAAGEEEDQVWSSMGVTPAVSANEAVLVAYHPYNDDQDLDIFAMPVEIASQTDYMYSGPVTGVTNAAPKADIVLDHALIAIRVNLVLGDFTGDVSVSEIAVASPALASSATLNAADGSLNNIAGQGDKFALSVDFGLVAGGTDNDIMFVPDASVESGVTTVSATIGGKKYTAGIEFDEAYKQGYIYTYTLTLNNSGFAVTKVNVNPWETGTNDSAVLQPEKDNAYIIKIMAKSSYNEDDLIKLNHNIIGFVGTIDWGDGTTDTYNIPVDYPMHEFPNNGSEYIIIAKGTMNALSNMGEYYYDSMLSECLKEIIYIGKDCGITSMCNAFAYCYNLSSISQGLFDNCTEVIDFEGTFQECSNITSIPVGLFKECIKVTNFDSTFRWTNLTTIPVGLFDHCTKVTDFSSTFSGTYISVIPEGLFDYCTEVTDFSGVFNGTNITNIPERLFYNNEKVTNFGSTFEYCTGLQAIPSGLFDNNTEVVSFYETFRSCKNLTEIPQGLFDKNTKVTDFCATFMECLNITSIPNGMFDNCPRVATFGSTFQGTSIIAIPEGLFDNCTEVTSFAATFQMCKSLQSVPVGLFDKCTKIENINYLFNESLLITGESPYTMININGEDVKVHLYERSNYPEYFTAPSQYSVCFRKCTKLSDYNSFPTGWK